MIRAMQAAPTEEPLMRLEAATHHEVHLPRHRALDLEYSEAAENLRRLEGLQKSVFSFHAPTVAVLAGLASWLTLHEFQSLHGNLWLAVLLGLFGFATTLASVVRNQRDSQLASALRIRLCYLEAGFLSERSRGALKEASAGGQYNERPLATGQLLGRTELSHRSSSAILHGASLGVWAFPVTNGVFQLLGLGRDVSAPLALLLTIAFSVRYILAMLESGRGLRLQASRAEARDQEAPAPASNPA